MKKYIGILFFSICFSIQAQSIDYNIKRGYVAEGYDVVSYFGNEPLKGDAAYVIVHDGVKYKFLNQDNLNTFRLNPQKYIPLYGGYCAYAVAVNNDKVSIDPKTYEIRDGKLYLFYNSWGTNTLELWKESSPEKLKIKADANWELIKKKN